MRQHLIYFASNEGSDPRIFIIIIINVFIKNIKYRDTCTLPGTMVQSVHEAYDKWRHKPPYHLNFIQLITATMSNVSRINLEANRP